MRFPHPFGWAASRLIVLASAYYGCVLPMPAATYQWVGRGDGSNIFTESNWTDATTGAVPAGGTIDPSVTVSHNLVVNGLTPGGGGGNAGRLVLASNNSLEVNQGTFRLATGYAIAGGQFILNGGVAYVPAFDSSLHATLASGRLELTSSQPWTTGVTVDFAATSDAILRFNAVAPDTVRSTYLGAITVNGVAAVENTNVLVWSDGASGTYVRRYDPNDTDGDGLPDAFENQYFGNLNQDGNGDPDYDGVINRFEYAGGTSPLASQTVSGIPDSYGLVGTLRREVWTGISGTAVSNLTSSTNFRSTPQQIGLIGLAESPRDAADNYGQRLRGWVKAPVTGTYKFWIAGDDGCELWLGTDGSKFTRRLLCSFSGWTAPREWNRYGSQVSAVVNLQAGQEYYIEALHKEGWGGDNCAVAWEYTETATNTLTARQVIPGSALRSWKPDPADAEDDYLPDSWETAQGLNPTTAQDGAYVDSDGDGFINFDEYRTGGAALARGGNVGFSEYQTFYLTNSSGKITDLTQSEKFAQLPNVTGYFAGAEANRGAGDSFGRRIRGVITIPQTGTYYFYIAGDDASELWLNTAGVSRFGKRRVAFSKVWTAYRKFTANSTQKSSALSLITGQKLYFEALYVEGNGDDHCSVGWLRPGISSPEVIPAQYVSTPADELRQDLQTLQWVNNDLDNDSMPDDWEAQNGLSVTNTGAGALTDGEYGDADGDGYTNFEEWRNGTNPTVFGGLAGYLRREMWTDIGTMNISAMLGVGGLLSAPDALSVIPGVEPPQNVGDNYGQRLRGVLTAPTTGNYTFWIAGDDNCELWLSTNERKFFKRRICGIGNRTVTWGYTAFREWDKTTGQKSEPIALVAGQKYFIEILHKEAVGADHVSVAWQPPGGQRVVVPASALQSFTRDAEDQDDDYLPDGWETLKGLNSSDNGRVNPANGEYGDPDNDGLINRDEYVLGTNPMSADSDGDGFSDGVEYFFLHTNPTVPDVGAQSVAGTVAADAVLASSGSWSSAGGGSIFFTQMRGSVDYSFTLSQAGIYLFEIVGRARGYMLNAREDFPLEILVDGKSLGRTILTSLNGGAGTTALFTPYLSAGAHTIRIWNQNLRANRVLQLDSVRILTPTGADANSDGWVDWLSDLVARDNAVVNSPAQSLTSPVCLEGIARQTGFVEVQAGGQTYPGQAGVRNQWHANVPLAESGATGIAVQFEGGSFEEEVSVEWVPVNVAAVSSLTVRKGDRLKLTAFTAGGAASGSAVTLQVNGGAPQEILDTEPLVQLFDTAGTQSVTATYQTAGGTATASLVVQVLEADFGPAFSVYCSRPRVWSLAGIKPGIFVQPDPQVLITEQAATAQARNFLVDVPSPIVYHTLARTVENGPILATGTLKGTLLSHTSSFEGVPIIDTLPNGDNVAEMTLAVSDLPPGGTIKLEIWLGGRLFEDGTTIKILRAEDFDASGLAKVRFILAGGVGSTCHRTYLYDANGQLIGEM